MNPRHHTSGRTAPESRSPVTQHLRLPLRCVPGYKGIPGDELAGAEAKAATTATSDPPRPISYAGHSPTQHLLIRGQRRCTVDSLGLKIADAVLLARL